MGLSEVSLEQIKDFCGVSGDDSDALLELISDGARGFILGYTGLDEAAADKLSDLSLAFMVLVNEMFTNRTYTVETDKLNPFVAQVLASHRENLL